MLIRDTYSPAPGKGYQNTTQSFRQALATQEIRRLPKLSQQNEIQVED